MNKRKYLFGVVEKYTNKPLTAIAEAEAYSPHNLVELAKEKWGIKVDGKTNAIDWIDVTED